MSFSLKIDRRDAAYVRFAGDIYDMINKLVHARESEGVSRADIARRMGKDRSQLSRILNGSNANLTIRTVADILYATEFEMERPVVCPLDTHGCNHPAIKPATTTVEWKDGHQPVMRVPPLPSSTISDSVNLGWQAVAAKP